MSRPRTDDRDAPGDPAMQLAELGNLYEVARSLLGAADPERVASRVVLAAMGSFGARSGAMFLSDERDRLRLAYAYGPDDVETGQTLPLDAAAREWLLREYVFRMSGTGGAAGAVRERLRERFDAAVGVAIADGSGLAGLIVLGPRLLDQPYDDRDLSMLDSLAGLAGLALGARAPRERPAPRAATRGRRSARPLDALRASWPPLNTMIGESQALLESCEDLVAVAATRFPVLLMGESGVGKEVAARAIHLMSDRRNGPMEVIDCGSIPRELIESELFGHVKGSFTGAHRDRRGAFELAHRGTLFLDEIGEMPLQLQTRLLRVLQEGRFRRVGDEQAVETDVRVIAATNRELKTEVASGAFRQDLFYRLNVFAVRLPALRERAGDVALLMRHFLPAERDTPWIIEPEVATALERHTWPGNIRELSNLCATLAVRGSVRGRVTLEDLEQVWKRQYGEAPPWQGSVATARGSLGNWVLEQARAHRFNLVEAARQLQKRKRGGRAAPVAERSALSYYLTGEILRALAETHGDVAAAALAIAGDDDLAERVRGRIEKVRGALRESRGDLAGARRRFGKLPAGYEAHLEQALAAV